MVVAYKEMALRALQRAMKPGQVVADAVALITYERDASLDRGQPDGVVFPQTVEDVQVIARWANVYQIPLVARGAGTGLSGGAVPESGGLIVAFARLNQVIELDEAGRSAVVQPGVVNLALDEQVKTKGLYYPPDPASGRAATIGGNIAENAGGPHCFKYGVTTNYITGLQVVLADGRLVRLGGRAFDYPEYDLPGLITGSEGTLALVTEASVRLIRQPPAVETLMAAFDSVEAAGEAVSAIIAQGLVPATMEMMDQKIMRIIEEYVHAGLPVEAGAALIVEVDGYPQSLSPQMSEILAILSAHQARNPRLAQTAAERDLLWYGRKSAAGAMARLAPAYYLLDGTVPRSRLAQTLAAINQICDTLDLRVGYVFHAGDGNLHPFILIPDPTDRDLIERVHQAGDRLMSVCVQQDGSITGEHGVGLEKRQYMTLMYSADELAAMADVKAVFDPKAILNPGKALPLTPPQPSLRPAPESPPVSPFLPTSAQEAAEALRAWMAQGQTIRLRGGGTKSAALPPTAALLSTAGLSGIRAYAPEDLYVTAGAGTPLAGLQAELARDRMGVPLVSPWPASTVGGIVATNFNAPLRMRYGGVRDLVLAATVVLPNGRVIRAGRPVVKNVAGYDLPKLFVGAHGTLGLIADVTLKLAPLPRACASLIAPVDDLTQGLRWGMEVLRHCLVASALLLCSGCSLPDVAAPYALIYTVEGLPADVTVELAQAHTLLQTAGATGLRQREGCSGNDLWAAWLSRQYALAGEQRTAVCRLGVAPKDLPGMLHRLTPQLTDHPFVADLASGLLYVSGVQEVAGLRRPAQENGGYAIILAGTPPDQADPWGHAPEGLELMRALKTRWDERGLVNPGAFLV